VEWQRPSERASGSPANFRFIANTPAAVAAARVADIYVCELAALKRLKASAAL